MWRNFFERLVEVIRQKPDPSLCYRVAVEMAWTDGSLSEGESSRLDQLKAELGLSRNRAREIEREIMGNVKEEVVAPEPPPVREEEVAPEPPPVRVVYREDPAASYRAAVDMAWADRKLNEAERERLGELELGLKVARVLAEEIEREIMGSSREELVSPNGKDEQWMTLVEECVGLVKDLDRHMDEFDLARRDLADHVILTMAEGLERSGVDLILDDEIFDSKRHVSADAKSRTASGATIAETLSPGLAVGRRVLRKAQVRMK